MESKQTPETKTVEEIIGGYNCFCLKGEDGNNIDVYDSESVKEMLKAYADQEKRKEAIAFAAWKDDNYINYLMRKGLYYHKRDLLKHIDEATVFTFDQLYDLYLLSLTQLNKEL